MRVIFTVKYFIKLDCIKSIKDPELPNTLEELEVVGEDCVTIKSKITFNIR